MTRKTLRLRRPVAWLGGLVVGAMSVVGDGGGMDVTAGVARPGAITIAIGIASASAAAPTLPPASGVPAPARSASQPPPLLGGAGPPSMSGTSPPSVSPASPSSPAPAPGAPAPGTAEGDAAGPPIAPAIAADSTGGPGGGAGQRPIPTHDATPFESDHDAVVGSWGVDVTPLSTRLPVFALRSSTGCPLPTPSTSTSGATAPAPGDCPPVDVSTFGLRHWVNRNWAVNGGLALAFGGGRDHSRLLDTYLAAGPTLGASLLIGNWRHLAVMASPGVSAIFFRAARSVDTTYVIDVHADLEAELHLGFWGLPGLSVSLRGGVLLRIERAVDVTQWSFGSRGTSSLANLASDVSLRYYF